MNNPADLLRAAALDLIRRGFSPIPIPRQKKGPTIPGWPSLRISEAEIPCYFNGAGNIGVVLGVHGAADVDLDCREAVIAGARLLPDTALVFGRASKRASHWIYWSDPPLETLKFSDPVDGASICELRGLKRGGEVGLQTVFPPSTHPSGEHISYEPGKSGHPANVEGAELNRAVRKVAAAALLAKHWPPAGGGRHDAMLALAGVLARGGWAEQEALEFCRALYGAIKSPDPKAGPRVENEVRDTFAKLQASGQATGIPRLSQHLNPDIVRASLEWLQIEQAHLHGIDLRMTEIGLAERMIAEHGADLRYDHLAGVWFIWDGRRWAEDTTAEVERRAKATVRGLYRAAAAETNLERRAAIAKFAVKSDSDSTVRHVLSRAAAEAGVPVSTSEFDCEPFVLNCGNGIVDLRTGALQPHARARMLSKWTPVEYDPAARDGTWEHFLSEATAGDRELQEFLQVAAGYSATGMTVEEKLFFIHGPSASGKSTFLEAVKAAVGDYAWTADFESFVAKNATGIRSDIAELAGRRFVVSVEVDEGVRLAEGLVKHLTGGDTVRARHLYQRGFEFTPRFKLWLCANHAPRVRDDDSAMWRRILRVPFEEIVPEHRRDPKLKLRLKDPAGAGRAVLAWLVEGAIRWHEEGLIVPASIRAATEAYRAEQDPLKEFFDDCLDFAPHHWVSAASLRRAYVNYCDEAGIRHPLGPRAFADRLRARHCARELQGGSGQRFRAWTGVRLREGA